MNKSGPACIRKFTKGKRGNAGNNYKVTGKFGCAEPHSLCELFECRNTKHGTSGPSCFKQFTQGKWCNALDVANNLVLVRGRYWCILVKLLDALRCTSMSAYQGHESRILPRVKRVMPAKLHRTWYLIRRSHLLPWVHSDAYQPWKRKETVKPCASRSSQI